MKHLLALSIFPAAFISLVAAQTKANPIDPSQFNPPIKVACIGDSITAGVGAEKGMSYPSQLQRLLREGWEVRNFGLSGRTLMRMGDNPYWAEKAFQEAKDYQPNCVIIMLGTNDTKPHNWKHHESFPKDYEDFANTFATLRSKPRLFLCRPAFVPEPGNFGINEANLQVELPAIDRVAKKFGAEVIDIHEALRRKPELLPDRVHPNTEGAAVMAQTVYTALTGKSASAGSRGNSLEPFAHARHQIVH